MTDRNRLVSVTEGLIEEAMHADSSHCMIAEAVKVAVPTAKLLSVDLQSIRYSDVKKGERYAFWTPPVAQRALILFDQGEKPEPFAFRLRVFQKTPIRARAGQPNTKKRPASAGPAKPLKSAAARGSVIVAGGGLPPVANLAFGKGRRRAFGLRAIKRGVA